MAVGCNGSFNIVLIIMTINDNNNIEITLQQRTAVAKTMLAMLLQRRMEILNQLEMIVGKQQQQQQQQLISPQIKTVKDHVLYYYIIFLYI